MIFGLQLGSFWIKLPLLSAKVINLVAGLHKIAGLKGPGKQLKMLRIMYTRLKNALSVGVALSALLVLAGCNPDLLAKHAKPLPFYLVALMQSKEMSARDPIYIRIFKEESELEVWKRSGVKYELLKTYEICTWSGELGPKFKEGDRQAPEGFYTVRPGQMNPQSSYHLSFNLGFPNPYDRALGRTGSHLMVHGDCTSAGCYAMEDEPIEEIYGLARDAFKGGQRAFHVHAFPFRMTPENMARHNENKHVKFWNNLKLGYDHFEVTKVPPTVDYCGGQYAFNVSARDRRKLSATRACPKYTVPQQLASLVAEKQARDQILFQEELERIRLEEEKRLTAERREKAEAAAKLAAAAKREADGDKDGLLGLIPSLPRIPIFGGSTDPEG